MAAAALSDGTALASRVQPELRRLCAATGETAAVSLVRGFRVLVVDQVHPPSVMSVSWMGREFPLHTSSPGKLVLALAPIALPAELTRPHTERIHKRA